MLSLGNAGRSQPRKPTHFRGPATSGVFFKNPPSRLRQFDRGERNRDRYGCIEAGPARQTRQTDAEALVFDLARVQAL